MIQSLRMKLTWLFLWLFLLIYSIGGGAALLVFNSGLSQALDEEITDLQEEIMPAIEYDDGTPSLKAWAAAAAHEHLAFPAGIQIFDKEKKLLETYGTSGDSLLRGEFTVTLADKEANSLRSNYEPLKNANKLTGYLQIQMSTESRDAAVIQFGLTMLLIFPFLSVAVALAGYFFSGLAIKPVEKSIQVLQTFVADAGHEFITPVTVVEASIQTLEEIHKEHGIGLEVLNIIARASSRMKELASDLIYLAKIDNPAVELPQEPINISDVTEPAIEGVIEIAKSKGVELSCSKVPDLNVQGNLHALKILLSNLLSNAIKYTESGGKVTLGVTSEGSKVFISVEDTGIGIPQEKLEQIFDRFYRVDQSRSRNAGGSGLGLAIVKAILDIHKAEIDVQSNVGKGSKFTVKMHRLS
ncbi:MAG: HAMP domain-containing histidine kinase [Candidatus Obscuribacterales bacterium]|nr:HAMP domain-containing histidine kinase [Candidatus Obscuribacterales bacterium]